MYLRLLGPERVWDQGAPDCTCELSFGDLTFLESSPRVLTPPQVCPGTARLGQGDGSGPVPARRASTSFARTLLGQEPPSDPSSGSRTSGPVPTSPRALCLLPTPPVRQGFFPPDITGSQEGLSPRRSLSRCPVAETPVPRPARRARVDLVLDVVGHLLRAGGRLLLLLPVVLELLHQRLAELRYLGGPTHHVHHAVS